MGLPARPKKIYNNMNKETSKRCASIGVLWVICIVVSLFDDDGVAIKRAFMASINGTIACIGLVGVVAMASVVYGLVMRSLGREFNRVKYEIIVAVCFLVCFGLLAHYNRRADAQRYQASIFGSDSCSTLEVRLVSQSLVDASKSIAEFKTCPSDLWKLTNGYVISDDTYEYAVSRLHGDFPGYQIPPGDWKVLDDGKGGRRMIWLVSSEAKVIVYDY
jgi:hypothetical protein